MSMRSPRHLVCLTFDFDALSLWLARGITSPTPISQGEFGAVGAERILALLSPNRLLSPPPGLFLATPSRRIPTSARASMPLARDRPSRLRARGARAARARGGGGGVGARQCGDSSPHWRSGGGLPLTRLGFSVPIRLICCWRTASPMTAV